MAFMTCAECIECTSEQIDGELLALDALRYEQHIARCPSCARYQRVLKRGLDLVRRSPVIAPSADFGIRLHRRLLESDRDLAQHQGSARSGAVVALAMAGVVALIAWSPILTPRRGPGTATAFPAATSVNETTDGTEPLGSSDYWLRGTAPTRVFSQPNAVNAFPGPYSPLLIDPPLGRGSTVLTSLFRAE